MAECDQNCSSCGESCGERKPEPDLKARLHEYSSVKKTIAVVSGKGGVGKSLVTAMTAAGMSRRGYKTAILDADLTGPSIPKVFGVTDKATGSEDGIFPVLTKGGIRLMSINLLLENESDPVLWRGPIIAATVKQVCRIVSGVTSTLCLSTCRPARETFRLPSSNPFRSTESLS